MRFGLLGHPLGHSLSPQLHEQLARAAGRVVDYRLFDLPPGGAFDASLPELFALEGFNVTIPHKQRVIPRLAALDESARRYGAVNTVACLPGGAVGYNTDCVGFSRSIAPWGEIGSALVIGAGGVGRMFAIELALRGARVSVAVRPTSAGPARALCAALEERFGVRASALDIGEANAGRAGESFYDLLVNASPCGMFPHTDGCPAAEELVARCGHVFDSIYNPAETRLLSLARGLGIPAMGGMRMLVLQGAAAQEIWYGASFGEGKLRAIERRLCGLVAGGEPGGQGGENQ